VHEQTSFEIACKNTQPKKISEGQSCVTASGGSMNAYGVYEIDLWIKGKKTYSLTECDSRIEQ
jgi:hypothetical protein